nr:hypothetical protein [uncultured Psychroserpens sp.]
MKTFISSLLLVLCFTISNAQSDLEIGAVYMDRAEQDYLDNDMRSARSNFDKAIFYIKEINDKRIARLGTLLSYDIKDYTKAKILAQRYFDLEPEKGTAEYEEMLILSVTIREDIIAKDKENERLRIEAIAKAKKERKLDSLTNLWEQKSQAFYVSIDSVGSFNDKNIAIYKSAGKFGIIDDFGNIIFNADTFENVIENEGYILFIDDLKRPSSIYCFNTNTQKGYILPDVSQFDSQAYDYGKLMLPRENGLLVTYPNKLGDVIVFDLNAKEFQTKEDKKELLKTLKKNDIIDKYDKDLKIRLEKEWFSIGSTIGGGFYPLFNEDKSIYAYLSTSNGRLYTADYYSHFGAFCDNTFQIIENNRSSFMDAEGVKQELQLKLKPVKTYAGSNRYVKSKNGKFQILKTENGKEVLIKGNQKLKLLPDYINEHTN